MTAVLPANAAPGAFLCPRCGSALREQQSWCLECGLAARTRIHPTPNWRLPVATTLVLLALLVAGIALALVTLLDEREPAPAATTVTVPATGATTTPATTPPAFTAPATTAPTFTAPTTTPTTATPTIPSFTAPAPTAPTTAPRSLTVPGTRIKIPIPASSR